MLQPLIDAGVCHSFKSIFVALSDPDNVKHSCICTSFPLCKASSKFLPSDCCVRPEKNEIGDSALVDYIKSRGGPEIELASGTRGKVWTMMQTSPISLRQRP